jgi:hypothetical protein
MSGFERTGGPLLSRVDRRDVRTDGPVNWRGVGAFLLLAYGLAWLPELIALARGVRVHPPTTAGTALLAAVMWAPAVAAFLVRRFVTREGFATAGLRIGPRRAWIYYLAAWLGVPVLVSAIYGTTLLLGLGTLDPALTRAAEAARAAGAVPPSSATLATALVAGSLTAGVLVTSLATFGEEFGWTGYLLPTLLPLGRWRAALIYGVAWGLWHAPIIVAGYNYPGHPVVGVFVMCAFTTAVALGQTAARLCSGSVLLTSVVHAGINAQGRGLWPVLVTDVPPLLGGLTGAVGIALIALVGAWLLARAPAVGAHEARG